MQYYLDDYHYNLPDVVLLDDLRYTAKKLGKNYLKYTEYEMEGVYNPRTLACRFGGWNAALVKAGLRIKRNGPVTDAELMVELKRVWDTLGRQPKWDEMVKPLAKYSAPTYARHFGRWRAALAMLVDMVNAGEFNDIETVMGSKHTRESKLRKRKAVKYISKGLRYDVFKRDKFKCKCGRAPANDPTVILHVDHKIPVSKGGTNAMDNLETMCNYCNTGKGAKLP